MLAAAAIGTGFGGENHLVVQIALILLGLGWGAVTVAGAALLTEVTAPQLRPKRQGQPDTVMNTAGALAGASSGIFFALGGFPLLSALCALIVGGGVVLALKLFRTQSR